LDAISTTTLFIILGVLILCSAYFSSSETGMMSLNRYRLKHLNNEGNRTARRVQKMLDRPDRLIGLILIGNNLVNIGASAIATVIGLRLFGDVGIAIATFTLTFVILVFAEVTPKTIAALYPEKIAFPSSYLLKPLGVVLYPFVIFVNGITNILLALFKISPTNNQGDELSPEELRTVVYEAGSLIPKEHQDMLVSILELENMTAEDIMIPRSEIVATTILMRLHRLR